MLEGIHLHLLQSQIILDLEVMKKSIPKNKFYSLRLCHCKKAIFENYINAYQIVLIRLCSKIYRYYEDIYFNKKKKEELKSYLSSKDLEKIFDYYSFRCLIKEEFISKRLLCLFYETQTKSNSNFFEYLNDIYLDLVDSIEDDNMFLSTYQLFTQFLKNQIEVFVFNLIGFNIDCNNIKDDIVLQHNTDETPVPEHDFCLQKCFESKDSKGCWKRIISTISKANIDENKGCIVHNNITQVGEMMHIIFVEDYVAGNCFQYKKLLESIFNKTKNPNNISIVLDFKLIKSDDVYEEIAENVTTCFGTIVNNFNRVYIYQDDDKFYNLLKNDSESIIRHQDFIQTDVYKSFFVANKEDKENTIKCEG